MGRVPENPTRTRKTPNPPETRWVLFLQKSQQNSPYFGEGVGFFRKTFPPHQFILLKKLYLTFAHPYITHPKPDMCNPNPNFVFKTRPRLLSTRPITIIRPKNLPLIEVTQNFDSEFDMAPLETVSPCDFLAPLKQDDSVFFVGSLNASSVPKALQFALKIWKNVQFDEIFVLKKMNSFLLLIFLYISIGHSWLKSM